MSDIQGIIFLGVLEEEEINLPVYESVQVNTKKSTLYPVKVFENTLFVNVSSNFSL